MPEKVKVVKEWKDLESKEDIRRFLGLCGYYRRFLKDYAERAIPLTKILKKNARFTQGERQKEAFEDLKKLLCEAPVLKKPNQSKDWILDCDASDFALGSILGQEDQDQQVHLVYYYSRQFQSSELNYSTTDKEYLAVVASVKKFRPYILGKKVLVNTDHAAIRWIINKVDLQGRYA